MGGSSGGGAPPPRNLSSELSDIFGTFKKTELPALNQFIQNQPILRGENQAYSSYLDPILQSGGKLTPEQTHDVSQYTQAGFAQRGNLYGNQALGAELLNRDAYRQQRFNTALSQSQGIEQQNVGTFATLLNPLLSYGSDLNNTNYNAQAAANIAGNNKSSGLIGGATSAIGSIAGAALLASDEAVKDNISDTGEKTQEGIPIKAFNYKGDDRRYIGVIAQDVEKKTPEAVVTDPNTGIKMVDMSKVFAPFGEIKKK